MIFNHRFQEENKDMPKIKLIASDLDGTLLLNGAQSCDPELFPLIEQLAEKGIFFVAASGRQYQSLQRLFAPVKDKIMYLCENGALVMYMNEVLVKKQFDDSLAMNICNAVIADKDCEIVISGERTCYLVPKSPDFVTHVREVMGNNVTVIKTPELIEEPIIKIAYFTEADKQAAVTERFKKLFAGTECELMTSGNRWVDFVAHGTGKGEALEVIGDRLGILPEEMAAFGDNENDRSMMKFVGQPYLMKKCNPTMEDIKAKRCAKVEEALKEILKEL